LAKSEISKPILEQEFIDVLDDLFGDDPKENGGNKLS